MDIIIFQPLGRFFNQSIHATWLSHSTRNEPGKPPNKPHLQSLKVRVSHKHRSLLRVYHFWRKSGCCRWSLTLLSPKRSSTHPFGLLFFYLKYSPVFHSDQRIHLLKFNMRPEKGSFQISRFIIAFEGLLQTRREKRLIFTNLRNSRERSSSLFQAWYLYNSEMLWGWDIILPFLIGIPGFFWQTQTVCVSCFEFFSRTPFARFPFKEFLNF